MPEGVQRAPLIWHILLNVAHDPADHAIDDRSGFPPTDTASVLIMISLATFTRVLSNGPAPSILGNEALAHAGG
jgi:hypothetical protein